MNRWRRNLQGATGRATAQPGEHLHIVQDARLAMSADMSAGHVQRERERAREREKQIEREREREIDVLEMVGEQEYMIEELLEKQREREKEMEGDNEKDMLDEELLKKDALGALGGLAAGSWAAQNAPDPAAQGQEQRLASLLGERSKGGRRSPFDTPPALVRNASSSGFSSSGKLRRGKRDSEDLLDTFAVRREDGRGC